MPPNRAEAKQGVGKVPKLISPPVGDSPARTGKAVVKMASTQSKFRDQVCYSKRQQQQTADSHNVH